MAEWNPPGASVTAVVKPVIVFQQIAEEKSVTLCYLYTGNLLAALPCLLAVLSGSSPPDHSSPSNFFPHSTPPSRNLKRFFDIEVSSLITAVQHKAAATADQQHRQKQKWEARRATARAIRPLPRPRQRKHWLQRAVQEALAGEDMQQQQLPPVTPADAGRQQLSPMCMHLLPVHSCAGSVAPALWLALALVRRLPPAPQARPPPVLLWLEQQQQQQQTRWSCQHSLMESLRSACGTCPNVTPQPSSRRCRWGTVPWDMWGPCFCLWWCLVLIVQAPRQLARVAHSLLLPLLLLLQNLEELIGQKTPAELTVMLQPWAYHFKRLLLDPAKSVRIKAAAVMAAVASAVGKALAPQLKPLLGPWYLASFDPYPDAAAAAKKSLADVFPGRKQLDALIFCR